MALWFAKSLKSEEFLPQGVAIYNRRSRAGKPGALERNQDPYLYKFQPSCLKTIKRWTGRRTFGTSHHKVIAGKGVFTWMVKISDVVALPDIRIVGNMEAPSPEQEKEDMMLIKK